MFFTRFYSRVVAGPFPATLIALAPCSNARGRRDAPGDDSGIVIRSDRNPL
jgi:hypothetical protein